MECALVLFVLWSPCFGTASARPPHTPTSESEAKLPESPSTVLVGAASSLRYALDELVHTYQQHNKTSAPRVSYASSGKLASQIAHGAPFDLFLSADATHVETIRKSGVTAAVQQWAIGELVVWQRANTNEDRANPDPRLSPGSLPKTGRIALASPDISPFGQRAQQALQRSGAWPSVSSRVVFAQDVAGVARLVKAGHASAGLMSLSLALSPPFVAMGSYRSVDQSLYDPIQYLVVLTIKGAKNPKTRDFVDHLNAPGSRSILRRYGYAFSADGAGNNR